MPKRKKGRLEVDNIIIPLLGLVLSGRSARVALCSLLLGSGTDQTLLSWKEKRGRAHSATHTTHHSPSTNLPRWQHKAQHFTTLPAQPVLSLPSSSPNPHRTLPTLLSRPHTHRHAAAGLPASHHFLDTFLDPLFPLEENNISSPMTLSYPNPSLSDMARDGLPDEAQTQQQQRPPPNARTPLRKILLTAMYEQALSLYLRPCHPNLCGQHPVGPHVFLSRHIHRINGLGITFHRV